MKKYALIYKGPLQRTRSIMLESESIDSISASSHGLDVKVNSFEHLVDFENQRVIPVYLDNDGMLVEIPDQPYGEETTVETFKELTGDNQ